MVWTGGGDEGGGRKLLYVVAGERKHAEKCEEGGDSTRKHR